jgi:transposase
MPVKDKKGRTKKRRIDLDMKQIDALLARAEAGTLQEGDYEIIKAMADCIVFLSQSVDEKAAKIKKLLRMIFGATTEKKENVLPGANEKTSSGPAEESSQSKGEEEASPKGHGRNGADDYPGASRVEIRHPDLKPNDLCPQCGEGRLYRVSEPGVEIRVKGTPPFAATIYELEKLRCNLCGVVFTAPLPETAGENKYDASAVAMIVLLKYGYGLPFNRLADLQANLGIPLPSSTQWDVIRETSTLFQPAYQELVYHGAQGELFFNDDTTMKVLALIKENQEKDPARKGMFTTGIVSCAGPHKIALFFTGRRHAGENLDEVFSQRDEGLPTPLQMCDGLDRNVPQDLQVILFNCLVHARRKFVDAALSFPEECTYVIDTLTEVYRHDSITKEQNMSADERLEYHKANSGPLMEGLHAWLNAQLDEQKVEPNSSLGDAIKYILKRWHKLTGFLRVPAAPLDNNVCERALKKTICHRKNSLFFKTERGAAAGDMFHSLIHTCELSCINPHDYLTALLNHSASVRTKSREWMPWNYKDTISRLPP